MPEPSRSFAVAGQQFGGQAGVGSEGRRKAPWFCPYPQKEEICDLFRMQPVSSMVQTSLWIHARQVLNVLGSLNCACFCGLLCQMTLQKNYGTFLKFSRHLKCHSDILKKQQRTSRCGVQGCLARVTRSPVLRDPSCGVEVPRVHLLSDTHISM